MKRDGMLKGRTACRPLHWFRFCTSSSLTADHFRDLPPGIQARVVRLLDVLWACVSGDPADPESPFMQRLGPFGMPHRLLPDATMDLWRPTAGAAQYRECQ